MTFRIDLDPVQYRKKIFCHSRESTQGRSVHSPSGLIQILSEDRSRNYSQKAAPDVIDILLLRYHSRRDSNQVPHDGSIFQVRYML